MQTNKLVPPKRILLLITALFMLLNFSSCARKISFQTSSVVPAANGTVKLTKDKNDNYKIKISLSNLAEPARLQPSKSTYVVWMETNGNGARNIGQINSSAVFFSGKLTAAF